MKLTFEDKLIEAEKLLQEKIKEGDALQISHARACQRYAKTQLENAIHARKERHRK